MKRKMMLFRITTLVLIIALLIPAPAFATDAEEVTPYSSSYLSSYKAYLYDNGGGDLQIWFKVTGNTNMTQIGALTIILKESSDGGLTWNTVKTYSHSSYPSMLGSNHTTYVSSVSYSGTIGRKYYALVTVWAGKDGGGDSRQIATTIIQLS